MKTLLSTVLLAALCMVVAPSARAQARYAVGDTVANFTLTDRATGRPVSLTDFAGKVVLLEWFAWWCPFCQAAAAQIEPGIVRYYAARNGNAAGIPVLHVSLNLQSGQESETQQFVNAYKLGLVLNDFNRAVANRFQAGGQPIFAVINGVAGSPSHRQWQLVFSQLGYGSTQAPVTALQQAIDTVRAAPPVAVPLAIATQPVATTVAVGASAGFSVNATGPGPLSYQWFKDGTALAGATAASHTLATVSTADAGDYTVRVSNPQGGISSAAGRLTVNAAPTGLDSRLSNLSVLTTLAANQVLTVGFTMQGGNKSVLLRAAGPSLGALGVSGVMADPQLALFNGSTQVATNNNWSGDPEVALAAGAVGAFPFAATTSLDAALVSAVDGGRTMHVFGPTAGTVIVEAYDAGAGHAFRLVNLSALNQVGGSGGNLLVAGFTIAGSGTKTVLIRAVGPGLSARGVSGALPDPKLELFDSGQTKIAENDNWSSALAPAFSTVGAFGLVIGSRDGGLLVTLPPGGYSVQVGPVGDGSGVALIEVYEVP